MKPSSFRGLSFLAATLFLLTACNNSEQSKTDPGSGSDSADHSTASATPVAPANNNNTVITTPQHMLVIRQKVKDFAAWKTVYASRDSARLAAGLHNYVISRGVDDSSTVMVALKADDIDRARAFAKSPGLKQAMQKGGIIGTPSIELVTMTFQDTVKLSSDIRSLTRFTVKDRAAWEKNFKDGEQERIANGLTVRAYGHDADDTNKVRLVTALVDTAKAQAYWKSDMLKKRRVAGGVMGEPERFVYRVVERY